MSSRHHHQLSELRKLNVKQWIVAPEEWIAAPKAPTEWTSVKLQEILHLHPDIGSFEVGYGIRIGNCVHVRTSTDPDAPLTRLEVGDIPMEQFVGGVSNLEDFAVKFKHRIDARRFLSSVHGFSVLIKLPGDSFQTDFNPGLGFITESDKSQGPTFFDTSAMFNRETMLTFSARNVAGGLSHAGDQGELCHAISFDSSLRRAVPFVVSFTGYQSTPLFKFHAQVPMGGIVDYNRREIHAISCRLDRVAMGDNTHAVVLVGMRTQDGLHVLWHYLSVPTLVSGVTTGTVNSNVHSANESAISQAQSDFARRGWTAVVATIDDVDDDDDEMPALEVVCGNNAGCEKVGSKRCTQCNSVKYCSLECQRVHWKKHKAICLSLSLKLKAKAAKVEKVATMDECKVKVVGVGEDDDDDDDVSPHSICAIQNGAPILASTLFVMDDSVFIQYGMGLTVTRQKSALDTARKCVPSQMLPLGACSQLMGTPAILAAAVGPVGVDLLPSSSSQCRWYVLNVTEDGLTDDLLHAPVEKVNGLCILHVNVSPDDLKKLHDSVDLAHAKQSVEEQKKKHISTATFQKQQLKTSESFIRQHESTMEKIIQNVNVTTMTAQLGKCGVGILSFPDGRLFMYRQTIVWPGLFDSLVDAGVEVTDILTPHRVRAWVQETGGLAGPGCPFPLMDRCIDQSVYVNDMAISPSELYDMLAGYSLDQLGEQTLAIRSAMRQLQYTLDHKDLQVLQKRILDHLTVLTCNSPELDELNAGMLKAGQDGDCKLAQKLWEKKKGILGKNRRVVTEIVGDVQNAASLGSSTKLANVQNLGLKMTAQLAHTNQNLDLVKSMSRDEVCDLMQRYVQSVVCVVMDCNETTTALKAVEANTFTGGSGAPPNNHNQLCRIHERAPHLDPLTWCCMSEGGAEETNHVMHVDASSSRSLSCPAGTGTNRSVVFQGEELSSVRTTMQHSLIPIPMYRRFIGQDSLIQPWQQIANSDSVQQLRQLLRGEVSNSRGFNISGASQNLTLFFIHVTLEAMTQFAKNISTLPGEHTLTDENRARVKAIVEAEDSSSNSTTTSLSTAAIIEEKEGALQAEGGAFFDTTCSTMRAMLMWALTLSGAGQKPTNFVYQLFSPGRSFKTPTAETFWMYPKMASFLKYTGCPVKPVLTNIRYFILTMLYRFIVTPTIQPMIDAVAAIDANKYESDIQRAEERLEYLQRVIPVVFHLMTIGKETDETVAIASRALDFCPSHIRESIRTKKRSNGTGIIVRFLCNVSERVHQWNNKMHQRMIMQTALNIWVKRSQFAHKHRMELQRAMSGQNKKGLSGVLAIFYAEAYDIKARAMGCPDIIDGDDDESKSTKESISDVSKAKMPNRDRIKKIVGDLVDDDDEDYHQIIETLKNEFEKHIKASIVERGPTGPVATLEPGALPDLYIKADLSYGGDSTRLKSNATNRCVPWSVKTELAQLFARKRRNGGGGKYDTDVDDELAAFAVTVTEKREAVNRDTYYIITGFSVIDSSEGGGSGGSEGGAVVGYQGPHADVHRVLIKAGTSGVKADAFIQKIDSMSLAVLWSAFTVQLPSAEFLDLMATVGPELKDSEIATELIRGTVLCMIREWRDREKGFRDAFKLFPRSAAIDDDDAKEEE